MIKPKHLYIFLLIIGIIAVIINQVETEVLRVYGGEILVKLIETFVYLFTLILLFAIPFGLIKTYEILDEYFR